MIYPLWASLIAQLVKNLPAMQETPVPFLGREDLLEKGQATHSSILPQRIPWTVQSMGLQESNTTEQLSLHFFTHFDIGAHLNVKASLLLQTQMMFTVYFVSLRGHCSCISCHPSSFQIITLAILIAKNSMSRTALLPILNSKDLVYIIQ